MKKENKKGLTIGSIIAMVLSVIVGGGYKKDDKQDEDKKDVELIVPVQKTDKEDIIQEAKPIEDEKKEDVTQPVAPVEDVKQEEIYDTHPKTEETQESEKKPEKQDTPTIEYLNVIADVLNVRSGPSTSYSIVGNLNFGETVARLRTVDNWSEIVFNNETAYVYSAYLTAEEIKHEEQKESIIDLIKKTPSHVVRYSKGENKQLSKNFMLSEFACKCSRCSEILVDEKLVLILQAARDHFGKPININSFYRCPQHNAEVGGASQSYHMKGMAADIVVVGVSPLEVAQYFEYIGVKGIGLYNWGVHVDTRDSKYFWDNRNGVVAKSTFGNNLLKSVASQSSTITQKFGIDISRWQGFYNLSQAKAEGVEYVIVKGGGGDDGLYKDGKFDYNYDNAKQCNLPIGCYFYSQATTKEQAIKEAEFFYSTCLKGRQFELPVYIDVEDAKMLTLSKDALTDIVKTFCNYIQEKGYVVGVYGSLYTFNSELNDDQLQAYEHWVACWANTCNYKYKDNLGMWQYGGETNTQRSKIVAGQVTDQNYMFKDYPKIIKAQHKNGF